MVYVRSWSYYCRDTCLHLCLHKTSRSYKDIFQEHLLKTLIFRYVTSNYFFYTVVVCGGGNKKIIYTLATSLMKYFLKLKMLQYFSLFNLKYFYKNIERCDWRTLVLICQQERSSFITESSRLYYTAEII